MVGATLVVALFIFYKIPEAPKPSLRRKPDQYLQQCGAAQRKHLKPDNTHSLTLRVRVLQMLELVFQLPYAFLCGVVISFHGNSISLRLP